MPAKMQRFLKKRGDGRIYPWTELLGARPDMEEIYAASAAEAANMHVAGGRSVKPNFDNMTRAQLFAYAADHYAADKQPPPDTKRPELVDGLKRLEAEENGETYPPPGDVQPTALNLLPPPPIVPKPVVPPETTETKEQREDREFKEQLAKDAEIAKLEGRGGPVNGNSSTDAN